MTGRGSQFGLTDEQWTEAKDEVRQAILDTAYDRRMTWYGEIAEKVSAIVLDPYSLLMNALLGAVFEDENAAGRPALTSIVTHKYGDKEPGKGFYDKARDLDYRFNEPYVFWVSRYKPSSKLTENLIAGIKERRCVVECVRASRRRRRMRRTYSSELGRAHSSAACGVRRVHAAGRQRCDARQQPSADYGLIAGP
jgi:hypothetical protein